MIVYFFPKANGKSIRQIKTILEEYYNVSDYLVNFHTSMVQFSKYTKIGQKHDIMNTLQVHSSNSIGSYLDCLNIDQKRIGRDFLKNIEKRNWWCGKLELDTNR